MPLKNDITNYVITVGEDCIYKMQVEDIFADAGIEVIPSIYATAGASGVIQKETFDYIEACFLRAVREHQAELDGIYLHLHGASEVEEIGSGERHILAAIRQIVGRICPSRSAATPTATCAGSMWRAPRSSAATVSRLIPTVWILCAR